MNIEPVIVPMFDAAAPADAWHGVRGPGGFEFWHMDAADASGTRVIVSISHGSPLLPKYIQAVRAYLADPTRRLPPAPADFSCVHLAVYQNRRPPLRWTVQYPAEQFAASSTELKLAIGPNRLEKIGDELLLTAQYRDRIAIDLRFTPRFSTKSFQTRVRHPRRLDFWTVANPLCDVRGEIRLGRTAPGDAIRFEGAGYCEHLYGPGPVGKGPQPWIRGRALAKNQCAAFQFGQYAHLVVADNSGIRQIDSPLAASASKVRTGWGMAYPASIDFNWGIALRRPRVIDSTPFFVRVIYDAVIRGNRGEALCEVMSPHRLDWPVVGAMVQRSVTRG
jgi:carotenoid 1,2-hydratase